MRGASRVATGCAGTRTAKVSSPAPASNATGQVVRRGRTMVSGPGQNVSASRNAQLIRLDMRERRLRGRVMADQRVEMRPPLGLENRGDGARIRGIGPQAINGLGPERDQFARRQKCGGLGDVPIRPVQKFSH